MLGPSAAGKLKFSARPKITGIGFTHLIAGHGMDHLGLQQESGRVRPIASHHFEVAAILRNVFQFYLREGTWSCNARNSCATELIPLSGIERQKTNRSLPLGVG